MKEPGTVYFMIGSAIVIVVMSVWGFWTLYQAGPPVKNTRPKNINTSTNATVVPVPVNTNRNSNTNPSADQITNMAGPTNGHVYINDGGVNLTVSNVNITTSGNTGTASWATNIPTGGIFYYGVERHTEHLVYVDGNNDKTNISVTFPVTPGTTYVYSIDPCYETPSGGATCVPQPPGTFTAAVAPTQSGAAEILHMATLYTYGILTVTWQTDLASNATIDWGATAAYGQTKSDYAYATNHGITIPVIAGQTTHYRLRSCTPMEDYHCTESADQTYAAP